MTRSVRLFLFARFLSGLCISALAAPSSVYGLRPLNAGMEESPVRRQLSDELDPSAAGPRSKSRAGLEEKERLIQFALPIENLRLEDAEGGYTEDQQLLLRAIPVGGLRIPVAALRRLSPDGLQIHMGQFKASVRQSSSGGFDFVFLPHWELSDDDRQQKGWVRPLRPNIFLEVGRRHADVQRVEGDQMEIGPPRTFESISARQMIILLHGDAAYLENLSRHGTWLEQDQLVQLKSGPAEVEPEPPQMEQLVEAHLADLNKRTSELRVPRETNQILDPTVASPMLRAEFPAVRIDPPGRGARTVPLQMMMDNTLRQVPGKEQGLPEAFRLALEQYNASALSADSSQAGLEEPVAQERIRFESAGERPGVHGFLLEEEGLAFAKLFALAEAQLREESVRIPFAGVARQEEIETLMTGLEQEAATLVRERLVPPEVWGLEGAQEEAKRRLRSQIPPDDQGLLVVTRVTALWEDLLDQILGYLRFVGLTLETQGNQEEALEVLRAA